MNGSTLPPEVPELNRVGNRMGMHSRGRSRDRCNAWKGGRRVANNGYVLLYLPDHPKANSKGYVHEHTVVMETFLGKPLPSQAVIHHINGNRADNRLENLLPCEDNSYHMHLHGRQEAFRACGHATWRWCWYCQSYDDPANMLRQDARAMYHAVCRRAYRQQRGGQ